MSVRFSPLGDGLQRSAGGHIVHDDGSPFPVPCGVQRIRLARLGIGHHFDAVVISGEVGASKPGHRIFDIAFEQLGQPSKSTVLMIGDSLSSDIAGGTNYGVATCWYNPHAKTAAPHHLVTHEITHLTELLAFVG